MRLLSLTHFIPIFGPLAGTHVVLVDGIGNVGDHLIYAATRQLLREFNITFDVWHPGAVAPMHASAMLLFGGGNLGSIYTDEVDRRQSACRWARAHGLPIHILPQSLMGPEPGPYARVFVREIDSLVHCPEGILAPDLSFGFDNPTPADPTEDTGIFLRTDFEGLSSNQEIERFSRGDPAYLATTVADYIALSARFRCIVTDRLHFAIGGLMNKRRVILLPTSYHKNWSMFKTWLRWLGCEWASSVPQALELARTIELPKPVTIKEAAPISIT